MSGPSCCCDILAVMTRRVDQNTSTTKSGMPLVVEGREPFDVVYRRWRLCPRPAISADWISVAHHSELLSVFLRDG